MIVINNLIIALQKLNKKLFMYLACRLDSNSAGVVNLISWIEVGYPWCYKLKKKKMVD